jgi:hypothetical protein
LKKAKRKRIDIRSKDIERLARAIAWLLIAVAIVVGALIGTGPA